MIPELFTLGDDYPHTEDFLSAIDIYCCQIDAAANRNIEECLSD